MVHAVTGRSSADSSVPRNGAGANVSEYCASPAIPLTSAVPSPIADIRIAGLSLCQDYLAQIREGAITCRPAIAAAQRRRSHLRRRVDRRLRGDHLCDGLRPRHSLPRPRPLERAWPRPCPLSAGRCIRIFRVWVSLASSWPKGRTSRCSNCKRDGSSRPGPVRCALPDEAKMRATIAQGQPPLDAHNALALTLAEELGVAPNVEDWPDLSEALIFGPLLPPRYRLSGPGAMRGAADLFAEQLAASPRAPVDPADLEALATFRRRRHGHPARNRRPAQSSKRGVAAQRSPKPPKRWRRSSGPR